MRKIYLFHIVHLLLHSCRIIMGNQAQTNRDDNNGIEGITDKVQETEIIVADNSIRTNDDEIARTVDYVDGRVGNVTEYTPQRPISTSTTYFHTITIDSTTLVNITTSAAANKVSKLPQNIPKKHLPKNQRTDAPMLNYIFDSISSANKHHHHDHRYGPHFEDISSAGNVTNITVQVGSAVYLNCRISLLQDKTVSWVRRKSGEEHLDLLTVGMHTYSGDTRYKMEFQYPNNWRLKIESAIKEDEGQYYCQISTHPPRVIQKNLFVNDPKVLIIDEKGIPLQDKYYEVDSTMQLSCIVRHVAMSTSVVYWSHGDRILNYDTNRGGVSVKTEIMEKGANSTLFIAKINKSDSGNYTCSINSTHDFTVLVHVLNETLRRHSPFGFVTRRCVKDYTIPDSNIVIENGTQVMISMDGMQMDPKFYKDPMEWKPERFKEEKVPFIERPFLSFGDGPRNCIGFRFSKLQTKLGLVLLLRKFKFELYEGHTGKELEISPLCLAKLPTFGINLKVQLRA